jgi:hypothetical protein
MVSFLKDSWIALDFQAFRLFGYWSVLDTGYWILLPFNINQLVEQK